ncbi:hypothetical protein F5884DRAFT_893705 [Xylogone sp. PMI_703]|nr:hypothetical protein F5884DRAFT_893705 [Xylogone sp. PMI_703]
METKDVTNAALKSKMRIPMYSLTRAFQEYLRKGGWQITRHSTGITARLKNDERIVSTYCIPLRWFFVQVAPPLPPGVRIRPGESSGLAMATTLSQTAQNGYRAILETVLQWTIVQITDEAFTNHIINDTRARLVSWFDRLSRDVIRWTIKFVRDVLQVEYLIETADSGQFSADVSQRQPAELEDGYYDVLDGEDLPVE